MGLVNCSKRNLMKRNQEKIVQGETEIDET